MFFHELQKRKNHQNPVSQCISQKSLETKCSLMSAKKTKRRTKTWVWDETLFQFQWVFQNKQWNLNVPSWTPKTQKNTKTWIWDEPLFQFRNEFQNRHWNLNVLSWAPKMKKTTKTQTWDEALFKFQWAFQKRHSHRSKKRTKLLKSYDFWC